MEWYQKRNSTFIIDLSVIRNNLRILKACAGDGIKVMPVIKANAYSHGSIEVAHALQDEADWFAVNAVEEGIELREAGVELPILVFGVPDTETAGLYARYNLTATVSSLEHFSLLPAGTEYQLNFDTGMGRLGFTPGQAGQVLENMKSHSELMCTGIYSHFATSDEPESPKVREQYRRFSKIRESFPDSLLTHLSNTGATLFFRDMAFNMIRSGIGIYGYIPGDNAREELQPALEWQSYLTQVKPIAKGETVSYGARWEAPRDGYIGVIPVGYEDGLKRILSGNISFDIGEKRYPQVGTITMNYCMVYLGQDRPETGTKVTLISPAKNDVNDWAQKAGTIPYEILTSLSPKIPRQYIGEE